MNFRWPEGSFPRSLKISIALTSNRNFRLHIQKPMFLYFHTSASNQRFTVIKICAHYVLIFAQSISIRSTRSVYLLEQYKGYGSEEFTEFTSTVTTLQYNNFRKLSGLEEARCTVYFQPRWNFAKKSTCYGFESQKCNCSCKVSKWSCFCGITLINSVTCSAVCYIIFNMEREPVPGTSTDKQEKETVAEQWKRYMDTKKAKLMHQINYMIEKEVLSNIFDGVSIFVNGYTNPPASELRHLVQLHGGEYHVYYEYGKTTYTVATHVAKGKSAKLRKNEKIIHPHIKAGERLPDEGYLLPKEGGLPRAVAAALADSRSASARNAANDPNYINNFYQRSRLHLISTLAQEMRRFVLDLRQSPPEKFASRDRLHVLAASHFTVPPRECICHIDLDCFFVSVALRSRPDLIGKPVAVAHSRGTGYGAGLSDVASCSYEARAVGVRNGMPVREAKKLCPNLICTPYQFEEYRTTSKQIYEIVSRYTVDIRAVSCDEMYVTLESLCKEMHITDIMGIVAFIRDEIYHETGCHASVGIGSNMLLARLATRHAKPNGQFLVRDEQVEVFMKKEKISSLPGIGYSTRGKFEANFGAMETCEELQKVPMEKLQSLLGTKAGLQIYNLCRGIDKNQNLLEVSSRKSVSCDVNYGIRFTKESELFDFLRKLSYQMEQKINTARVSGSSLTLRLLVRSADAPIEPEKYMGCGQCDVLTRSTHLLSKPLSSATVIFEEAKRLAKALNPVIPDLRGIGLQLTHLKEEINPVLPKQVPHTLADFFKVQGAPRKKINKEVVLEEDLFFKKAVRESIRDEAERKLKRVHVRPFYYDVCDDLEVKAKMSNVLSAVVPGFFISRGNGTKLLFFRIRNHSISKYVRVTFLEPLKQEVDNLVIYFYQLVQCEDLPTVVSQLRFLERKSLESSGQWGLVVATLKSFVQELCESQFGSRIYI
ncbi:unnamed protein product [Enterobius vermicularis]|uniref:DNA repair protein REV1 n=1 Tax=Enterobius vermicularis TaxID=51028 RepID=A0A0N4V9B9_ENTVE|nr:unnamed protein product [Enterobius vermicularis]